MISVTFKELEDLERESKERGIPILGKYKGRWLYNKVRELKPKRILELGTANGYSGIILGRFGASLTSIEKNKELALEARANFKKFKVDGKVINGDGLLEIKKFEDNYFDLVFIDFAKRKYIQVLEEVIRVVNKNGFIIADNIEMDEVQEFKNKVLNDKGLETEIIDIVDGLSCSRKI